MRIMIQFGSQTLRGYVAYDRFDTSREAYEASSALGYITYEEFVSTLTKNKERHEKKQKGGSSSSGSSSSGNNSHPDTPKDLDRKRDEGDSRKDLTLFDRNGNVIADWLEEETDDEWVYSGSGWDHVSTLEDGVYGPTASQIRALYDEYARISGNKSELYTAQGIPKVDMFDELTETIVQLPENKKGAVEIASSNNAVLNDEHRDYLERVADSNTPAAYWAQQQLNERRYFIDPDEPDVVYSLDEVDGGVKYDYIPEAVAVTVIASCIVSCGTVVTAVSDAMDVGSMGTTIATSTVIVGGKVTAAVGRILGKGKGAEAIVTSFDDVASYVAKNNQLPDNFITKDQARTLGWDPRKGNLHEVAPGKSIGGDIFKNRGNPLPDAPNRVWYEADINYTSGHRGSERLIYSNDGLIYKTTDLYKTFEKIK